MTKNILQKRRAFSSRENAHVNEAKGSFTLAVFFKRADVRYVFKSRVSAYPGFENAKHCSLKTRKIPIFQTAMSQGSHLTYLGLLDKNVMRFRQVKTHM